MKITKEEILHVAHLARLEIDATAIEKFVDQIGTVLEYVDQLKGVDTEGVRPTSHAISRTNAFREDEQSGHLDPDCGFEQCPRKRERKFYRAEGGRVSSGLRVAGYGLRVAGCGLRVAGYGLRVAGCELRVAGCGL